MEQNIAIVDTSSDPLLDCTSMQRELDGMWDTLVEIQASLSRLDELRM